MATSKFRSGSRSSQVDEDILALNQLAANVTQQKQATQLSGAIGDLSGRTNAISSAVQTSLQTIEAPQPQPTIQPMPQIMHELPSEVVQFCYLGQPAEFRMYGGFIRFL